MKILAIPKKAFDENFTSENIKRYDYAAFISILDPDNEETKYEPADNFLQVKMWDIEQDEESKGRFFPKPPDSELKKIVEFVEKHKDKICFIVHCSAGVSRSGAVVTYIREKYNVDYEEFRKENKSINPNRYILNQLWKLD